MRKFSWPSRRARRAGGTVAGIALAVLLLRNLIGGSHELHRAASLLVHPRPGWLCLAAGAEVMSFLAYAAAQCRLLRAAEQRLTVPWLASLAVAAQAVNNFLPVGYVMANVLNFRELRRRDVTPVLSGWLLVTSSVLYVGVLALGALAASLLTGSDGGKAAADIRMGALALLAALGVLAAVVAWLARRGRFRRVAAVSRVRAQLSVVRLPARALGTASGLFAAAWVADAACLVASFVALGITPPWRLLPLAYCAAQLVSFLPVTPGGLGLVEGSLALTLSAGGGGGAHLLAGVFLYRVLSYWATAPGGVIGYLMLRRSQRAHHAAATTALAPALPAAASTSATP